jgi:2-polyprenyl-3-methyl-5-hydroxy-6-metoxy-1,4-benzoquinol methylase
LDVGCSSGVITEKIKSLGHNVEGIDISEEAIKKLKGKDINGQVCDVNNVLPGGDILAYSCSAELLIFFLD